LDGFLERHKLSKWAQEKLYNPNKLIAIKEIKLAIKVTYKENLYPDGFPAEFCQTCTKKNTNSSPKLFQKIEEEGTLPNILQDQYYPDVKTK
jgi:hypothetical protein